MSEERRRRGPSQHKRRAILDAALGLFLERGFAGTSMDDIAAEAEVSKQTVYAHFGDKPTLFTELITAEVGRADQPHPLAATMAGTEYLEKDLRSFARDHLALVLTPELVRLRRMLIAEAERFPDLAQAWYDNGPVRSFDLFSSWFAALDQRGLLRVPDPDLAAQMFNWLVLSIPLNRAMSLPAGHVPLGVDLDRYADEGVRVFLAAYAPT